MKRFILSILIALPLCISAQEQGETVTNPNQEKYKFGVINYNAVLEMIPEYQEAMRQVAELKVKYDAESLRAEREMQDKFAEFLEGQKSFPENILQKRQHELQTLLEESIAFRHTVQKLLKEAEANYTEPARRRLSAAMSAVAKENSLLFIFDESNDQIPYVDVENVLDVETLVVKKMNEK